MKLNKLIRYKLMNKNEIMDSFFFILNCDFRH